MYTLALASCFCHSPQHLPINAAFSKDTDWSGHILRGSKKKNNIQMGAFQELREFRLEFSATRLPCKITFSLQRSSANTHSVLIQVEPERCQVQGDLLARHYWMKILLHWCFGASSCARSAAKNTSTSAWWLYQRTAVSIFYSPRIQCVRQLTVVSCETNKVS